MLISDFESNPPMKKLIPLDLLFGLSRNGCGQTVASKRTDRKYKALSSHNESPCCNHHRNFPTSGHSNIIYIVKTQDIAKLLAYLICSTSWLSKNYSSKWTWLVWIFTKPRSSELIIHCNPPTLGRRVVKLQGLKDCRQPAVGPLGALEANSYVIFNQALLR